MRHYQLKLQKLQKTTRKIASNYSRVEALLTENCRGREFALRFEIGVGNRTMAVGDDQNRRRRGLEENQRWKRRRAEKLRVCSGKGVFGMKFWILTWLSPLGLSGKF